MTYFDFYFDALGLTYITEESRGSQKVSLNVDDYCVPYSSDGSHSVRRNN